MIVCQVAGLVSDPNDESKAARLVRVICTEGRRPDLPAHDTPAPLARTLADCW